MCASDGRIKILFCDEGDDDGFSISNKASLLYINGYINFSKRVYSFSSPNRKLIDLLDLPGGAHYRAY